VTRAVADPRRRIAHVKTALAITTAAITAVIALAATPATNTRGAFVAAAATPVVPASAFVHRTGSALTLNGRPWRFVGFNDYQLTSEPGGFTCGRPVDSTTLNSIIEDAKSAGATVIRTWFFQSYYDLDAHGQQTSPNWSAFDRILTTAAAHGLKVIPVLVNEWQDCEPASVNKNLGFYETGYESPGYGYPLSFKAYATTVAAHYAANPTIAFWQIGNELENNTPSGCDTSAETAGAGALRAFADDITTTIKTADTHHLVSLGTIGSGQCGLSGTDYEYVHAGNVDLCEYHDYGDPTHPIPDDGFNRLAQRITQCQTLDKPLFIGEAAIGADIGAAGQSTGVVNATSLQVRANFFDAKITAAFNAGVSGYLLWEKQQDASNSTYNLDNGLYDVGPNSLDPDPTNTVTATIAASLTASLPPPPRIPRPA
jgi:hypothetical protein